MVFAGGVVVFVGMAIMVILLWVFGAILESQLREIAVPMFLEIPAIGPLDCTPPGPDATPPAYDWGDPGRNTPGCFHRVITIIPAVVILGVSVLVAMLLALFHNVNQPDAILRQYFNFISIGVFFLFVIFFFHSIHDFAGAAISHWSIGFAAFPHNPPAGDEVARRAAAEESIMTPISMMRDFSVAEHACFNYVDTDGDGENDDAEPDIACIVTHMLGNQFSHALLVATIGSFVSVITMIIIFIVAVMRYFLTAVLAVGFPLLLALSRVPLINGLPKMLIELYIGLMMIPLIVGIFSGVGPGVVLSILNEMHASGVDPQAEKYAAFIMMVGLIYAEIALMLAAGRIMGHAALMATGMIMTSVNQFGHAAARLGTAGAGALVGGAAGSMFAMGAGSATQMFGWGAGSTFGGMGSAGGEGGQSANANSGYSGNDIGEGMYSRGEPDTSVGGEHTREE